MYRDHSHPLFLPPSLTSVVSIEHVALIIRHIQSHTHSLLYVLLNSYLCCSYFLSKWWEYSIELEGAMLNWEIERWPRKTRGCCLLDGATTVLSWRQDNIASPGWLVDNSFILGDRSYRPRDCRSTSCTRYSRICGGKDSSARGATTLVEATSHMVVGPSDGDRNCSNYSGKHTLASEIRGSGESDHKICDVSE